MSTHVIDVSTHVIDVSTHVTDVSTHVIDVSTLVKDVSTRIECVSTRIECKFTVHTTSVSYDSHRCGHTKALKAKEEGGCCSVLQCVAVWGGI